MKHDGKINIAIGLSRETKVWKNKKYSWSEFVRRISEVNRTSETFKEYMAAPKQEQLKIKDVGGYVGGYLRKGRRNPENVVNRQLATLDIDFAHLTFWDDFTLFYNNAAILHSTHKHCEESPRFRLIMPLSRECTPDEYVAVSRYIAGTLDIDLFDNTTFETNRLMFWPSVPKDVDYYFEYQDGPWVDVDTILESYEDWTDSSLWPTADRRFKEIHDAAKKQEDPEHKKGIIGAFCRTYTVDEAIEKFLSDVYTESAIEGRYTYKLGTAASGLITYDGKFAYSHHGTDPAGNKLCNAFDLVRIHKFSHLDSGEETKVKSMRAMDEFVRELPEVKKTIASENLSNAKYDFQEDLDEEDDLLQDNVDWMTELEVDSKGGYLSTASNINLIFANDSRLKGIFKFNSFDQKRYVFENLPWRKVPKPEPVKNVDYSGVRNYLEVIYGITGTLKIEDALSLEFEKRSFNPVLEYLEKQEWDGTKRIDRLLVDYFGADDNIYTHEAIRKMLVGSVSRIYRPGCKFDLVLTLVGDQGTYKSTFIKTLGKEWFSDTFMTVQGKEALEQIQGSWLIEMAELAGLKKAEVEAVKHFISKQEDTFRPAYAKTPETYKRQCTFWGTTNNKEFLRDPSGNRRFMPIDVNPHLIKKDVRFDLEPEVDQIWAEAVHLFKKGEPLFLSKEAEKFAKIEQQIHSEQDERQGMVEKYLDTLLPENWDEMDIFERKTFIEGDLTEEGKIEREYVCIAEIWCECLGKDKKDLNRYASREINDIMRSLGNWEQKKSPRNFKLYGKQKYYERKLY